MMHAFIQLHGKKIKRRLRDVVLARHKNRYAYHAMVRYQGCVMVVGSQSEDAATWYPLAGWDPTAPQEERVTLDELLKRKQQMDRPLIVTHCGSTSRAQAAFEEWRLKDTLDGMIVLTIGAAKNDSSLGITPEQAIELDILHLWKIEAADFVRILNVGGYIGESTRRELEYANRLKKGVWFLEEHKEEMHHAAS